VEKQWKILKITYIPIRVWGAGWPFLIYSLALIRNKNLIVLMGI
jgi:hypothetical protein